LPTNLAELAAQAWIHAKRSQLIDSCRNLNFRSSNSDLERAWVHDPSSSRSIEIDQLVPWQIESFYFEDSEIDKRIALVEETELAFKQLSGILRVLVVAFENFIQHGKDGTSMQIAISKNSPTLMLQCRNVMADSKFIQKRLSHGGFRGLELISYLCAEFIGSEKPDNPVQREKFFEITIPIGSPLWLREAT